MSTPSKSVQRPVAGIGETLALVVGRLLGAAARAAVWALRRLDPDRCSDLLGGLARRLGPWLAVSRVGRENLRAAFPEKAEAEIEAILKGVWENLGRFLAEFVHLDRLWDWEILRPDRGRMLSPSIVQFLRMRDDGKPALIFTAHLANWEIPAVAAAAHGARCTIVVRPPNSRVAAIIAEQLRETSMGRLVKSQPMAAFALAAEIERGSHVGMLVDQFWRGGPLVTFFGRECPVNPTIARLARRFECEVRGTRIVRLPGNRFSVDLTPPLELPRDDAGKVDVAATMQMITTIVEGWIREYPEQWLWLHRRWRDYS